MKILKVTQLAMNIGHVNPENKGDTNKRNSNTHIFEDLRDKAEQK
jgi:hypothetical protein